jgi:putative membrane protein
MKYYLILLLKGFGMGAANVIPGVSGGTIALVTGIYEQLINSLKSFNIQAVKLLFSGNFKSFIEHIQLKFLVSVFSGTALSIFTLAKVLEFFFSKNEQLVWSFFFGLILASIYYVGKMVKSWNISTFISLVLGIFFAASLAFLKPVTQDDSFYYLIICGIVSVASMILPGLSGSYVLILMGNYQLIMLQSVSDPFSNLNILLPVMLGAVVGFLGLSHGISFVLKKFYNSTISLLTGFVVGSLLIIWPWKIPLETIVGRGGELKVVSYSWVFPDLYLTENIFCLILSFLGIFVVWLIEFLGSKINSNPSS